MCSEGNQNESQNMYESRAHMIRAIDISHHFDESRTDVLHELTC